MPKHQFWCRDNKPFSKTGGLDRCQPRCQAGLCCPLLGLVDPTPPHTIPSPVFSILHTLPSAQQSFSSRTKMAEWTYEKSSVEARGCCSALSQQLGPSFYITMTQLIHPFNPTIHSKTWALHEQDAALGTRDSVVRKTNTLFTFLELKFYRRE